ncbi:MAG: hypothetical protein AB7F99_00455 [Vicinamibacterales bacterium]
MADSRPADTDNRSIQRERWLVMVSLAFFAALYAIHVAGTTFRNGGRLTGTLFDDALISLRYAQNFVNGYGLVWNPGEQPPVEGYTNLGWTLVMALVAAVAPHDIAPIGVSLAGGAVLVASGLVAWSLLQTIGASRSYRLAGTLLVLASYPTVFWTLRGMEVGLLSLLLLVALRFVMLPRDRRPASQTLLPVSSLAGIAVLVRNDAAVLFIPLLVYAAWRHERFRHALAAILPLTVCALAQVIFRYVYYQELAPNTYVLKMTGVATGERLAAGFVALVDTLPPIAPATLLIGVAAFATRVPRTIRDFSRLVLAILAMQWAYLVYIGGDAWLINYSSRFIAAVMPMLLVAAVAAVPACVEVFSRSSMAAIRFATASLLLLVALGLKHPHTIGPGTQWLVLVGWLIVLSVAAHAFLPALGPILARDRAMAATALGLFLVTSAHGWLGWARYHAAKAPDDIAFARLGLMLRDRLPPDAVVAAGWVGAPAYFSRLKAIDLLGKTDPYVARAPVTGEFRPGHNKMDLDHSIGRLRPDVVVTDDPALSRYGYDRQPNGLWIRHDSPVMRDTANLTASWCNDPSDSVYCPNTPVASR